MSENDTNPILDALLSNDFERAVGALAALEQPKPQDLLFAGMACLSLDQTRRALEHLLHAQGQGLEDAAPLVAATHRQTGEFEHAQQVLENINTTRLSAFGRALLLREQGLMHLRFGQARNALEHLKQAFELSLKDAQTKKFRALFAKSLSAIYSALGRDAKVLETIAHALETASASARPRLLLDQAIALTNTGAFSQAEQAFTDLSTQANPSMEALVMYYRAHLDHVRGLNIDAAEKYNQATVQARHEGQAEVEAFAELGLVRIATKLDDEPLARAHLNRAQALAEGDQLRAEIALAQGALLVRRTDPLAIQALEQALQGFEQLQLERDAGLTQLHLGEAHLRLGNVPQARTHLEHAVDCRHALRNGVLFAAELRALPAVLDLLVMTPNQSVYEINPQASNHGSNAYLKILLEDWRTLENHAPAQIMLTTLGRPDLRIDGARPRIESGLSRTVSLLAYLADQGSGGVEDLIDAVFADESNSTSRQYIHNIRSSLKRTVPNLTLPFEERSRSYSLKPEGVRFAWDVALVRDALELGQEAGLRRALALYTGTFLPQAQSNWAFEVRLGLQKRIGQLGLSVLEDLRGQGLFEPCIDLAERLLEINTVDVPVVMLLVDVIRQARGTAQAKQRLSVAKQWFMHEFDDVPEEMLRLETSHRITN